MNQIAKLPELSRPVGVEFGSVQALLYRGLLALYLVLLLISPSLVPELGWGIIYASLFGLKLRLVWTALVVVLFIPQVARQLSSLSAFGATLLHSPALFSCLVLAIVIGFWSLSSQTVYGDGLMTINNLELGQLINWKEPLDRYLTAQLYRMITLKLHLGPLEAIQLISCAAGMGWLVISRKFVLEFVPERSLQLSLFLILNTSGLMQLFFGNIENYSLLACLSLLFLYLGLCYLSDTCSAYLLGFSFSLMCWTHMIGLVLFPSLLYLIYLRTSKRGLDQILRELIRVMLGGLPLTLVTIFIGVAILGTTSGLSPANFGGGDASLLVPIFELSSRFHKFTMFSWAHILALINEVMLVAVAPFIFISSVYLARLWTYGRRARLVPDPHERFILVALVCALTYIFLFNPDLAVRGVGILNEWDLFSLPAVPLSLLACIVLSRRIKGEEQQSQAILAVLVGGFSSAAWILYNARVLR